MEGGGTTLYQGGLRICLSFLTQNGTPSEKRLKSEDGTMDCTAFTLKIGAFSKLIRT
jgi:hypothetical protein